MKFIAIIVIIIGGYLIFTYNRALNWQMKIDNIWVNIKSIIEEKIDFVPILVDLTQKHLHDCDNVFEFLSVQRQELMNSQSENENVERNEKLDRCIEQLFEFCDYYTDLNDNLAYIQFHSKFNGMKSDIIENIQIYNNLVTQYNKLFSSNPNNYVIKIMGFNEKELIKYESQKLIENK